MRTGEQVISDIKEAGKVCQGCEDAPLDGQKCTGRVMEDGCETYDKLTRLVEELRVINLDTEWRDFKRAVNGNTGNHMIMRRGT